MLEVDDVDEPYKLWGFAWCVCVLSVNLSYTCRCRLRGRFDSILHRLLLQRHHRMVVVLLLRLIHHETAMDLLQQLLEHTGLL